MATRRSPTQGEDAALSPTPLQVRAEADSGDFVDAHPVTGNVIHNSVVYLKLTYRHRRPSHRGFV